MEIYGGLIRKIRQIRQIQNQFSGYDAVVAVADLRFVALETKLLLHIWQQLLRI